MYKIRFILSIILLLIFSFNYSQENLASCGTIMPENYNEIELNSKSSYDYYLNEFYDKYQNKTSTALTDVPAKLHIVTDDGGDTSITVDEIFSEIDEANEWLANSFLRINVCDDINYINSSFLYDFDLAEEMQYLYENHQQDILNIYFVESITSSSGSGICGYTYMPGNPNQYYDVIVMDNQCTNSSVNQTLAHEFGHHFNLIHTHGPENGVLTDELVTGTNCSSAGDRLCDTPADPQLSSSNVSNVNCLYSGTAMDEYGFLFQPDPSNIMSYAPQVCRDNFTIEQYARMYAGFHTFKTYYECPSFNIDFYSENIIDYCNDVMTVNFFDDSVGAISWEWDVNGDDIVDYTEQNFSHNYIPGVYDVTLKISNENESITKVFPEYINLDSSLFETSKIILKLVVVDTEENTWELKNSNDEIIYSGGPYSETGEHTEELDVIQSECYNFTIYDSSGNGLAANFWTVGTEYYELTTEEGELIRFNQEFEFEETTYISTNYLNTNRIIKSDFFISPNPSDSFIRINYFDGLPDYFEIYNINGRLIKNGEIYDENDLTISTNDLSSGMYFISLFRGFETEKLKFIVK
jgi:PKD repeat protein